LHNVDILGSDSDRRWASHLIRFAFPVVVPAEFEA
jgi:hypothetical protein